MKRALELRAASVIAIISVIALILPFSLHAQATLQETTADTLILSQDPQAPAPDTSVTFTLSSYTTRLSLATISWYVDGTLASRGTGQDTFTLNSGNAGSTHSIRASIISSDGKSAEVTSTIRPATVSLTYEGVTYTPPFYRGRALPSADAAVRIHADAQFISSNGTPIPQSSIAYTWTINTRVMQNLSGLGKSDLLIKGPSLYGTQIVSVQASASGIQGSQSVRIPAVTPVIALYSDDPLLGMQYHTAISADSPVRPDQSTLVAEPYFFSVSSPVSPDLIYKWSVNGTPVLSDASGPSRITINVEGGKGGTAAVSLDLSSKSFPLEDMKQSWQVHILPQGSRATPFTTPSH